MSFSLHWLSPKRKRRKRGRTSIKLEEEALIGSRCQDSLFTPLSNQSRVWSYYPIRQLRVHDVWSLQGAPIRNMNECLGLCDSLSENTHTYANGYCSNVCGTGKNESIAISHLVPYWLHKYSHKQQSSGSKHQWWWLGDTIDCFERDNWLLNLNLNCIYLYDLLWKKCSLLSVIYIQGWLHRICCPERHIEWAARDWH